VKKVKIIVDSTGDMPQEWSKKLDVETIPLHVLWSEEKSEKDTREESGIADFWSRLKQTQKLPTTSQPTPKEFSELYDRFFSEGYEGIFVITISAKLSGTYNSATIAAKDQEKEIVVWDSRLASSPLSLAAMRARELSDQGKSLEEIKQSLEEERNANQCLAFFYVSDFEFLRKGGRVSRFQSFVGSMLKIRAALTIDPNGELVPFGKARGTAKVQELICEEASKFIPKGSSVKLAMVHADNLSECKEVQAKLSDQYKVLDSVFTPMGKIISSHVGPGTAGFGIYWMKSE